jgi:hypothetical protein
MAAATIRTTRPKLTIAMTQTALVTLMMRGGNLPGERDKLFAPVSGPMANANGASLAASHNPS